MSTTCAGICVARTNGTSTAPDSPEICATTCQIPSIDTFVLVPLNAPGPDGWSSRVYEPTPDLDASENRRAAPGAWAGGPVPESVTTAATCLEPPAPGETQ